MKTVHFESKVYSEKIVVVNQSNFCALKQHFLMKLVALFLVLMCLCSSFKEVSMNWLYNKLMCLHLDNGLQTFFRQFQVPSPTSLS